MQGAGSSPVGSTTIYWYDSMDIVYRYLGWFWGLLPQEAFDGQTP